MVYSQGSSGESGTAPAVSDAVLLGELQEIRAALDRQHIRCCGCAHEWIIAQQYNTESKYRAVFSGPNRRAAALTVLCPEEVRQNSPMCAHASTSLDPDPFGPQLRRLDELGMVDQNVLDHIANITNEIRKIDTLAAIRRWEGREHQRRILAKKLLHLPLDQQGKARWVEERMNELMPEAAAIDADWQQATLALQEPLVHELERHRRALLAVIDTRIAHLMNRAAHT